MKSSNIIEKLIEASKQYVYVDLSKWIMANEELLSTATMEQDEIAIATAYFFIGETEYWQSKLDSALEYFYKVLTMSKELKDIALEGKCCNMIGSIYCKKSNESAAIDYFHQSIHCLKEIKNYSALSSTYMNMASVYINMEQYEKALACYKTADYYDDLESKEHGPQADAELNQLIFHINYSLLYEKLQDYEKATEYLDYLHSYTNNELLQSMQQYINVANAKVTYKKLKQKYQNTANLLDYSDFLSLVEEILYYSKNILYNADVVHDYLDILDNLIEISAFCYIEEMLHLLENTAKKCHSNTITLMVYQRKLSYYETLGDTRKMEALYDDYFQLLQKRHLEMDRIYQSNLLSHIKIEEDALIQQSKDAQVKELEQRSSYDSLTGLANRNFLNIYGENQLHEARQNNVPLGIIVLDVDEFKSYNDTYGHIVGDYCLMQVATSIRDNSGNAFAARFGGDEFVLISYNAEEEKLISLAKSIQEDVANKLLPTVETMVQSNITLSIGYYYSVPTKEKSLNDFIRNADKALYRAKDEGKGHIVSYL